MEEMEINPDSPDVTCEFGYYPYCPLCPYGYEYTEEWMLEDNCIWVCTLAEKRGEK